MRADPARLSIGLALAATTAVALVTAAAAQPLRATGLGPRGEAVHGAIGVVTTFVSVPPGFAVDGGTVDLRFSHSALLRSSRSSVTLVADGTPLASARLTHANARAGHLEARLPRLMPAGGGFTLEARFGMRLTRDDCEDSRNPALWARVLPETRIDARLVAARRSVGAALEQLAPPAAGEPISVRLPRTPSDAELAVAGFVAAGLGRADAVIDADPLVVLDARSPGVRAEGRATRATARSGIAGFEVASGAGLAEALARVGVRRVLARDEGILAVARRGVPRLVVGGADATGLAKAAAAISGTTLTRSTARVVVLRRRVPQAPRASQPWSESAASFEQLGIPTRRVAAIGLETVNLPVDRPPSWTLRQGGRLDLVVQPGSGLRKDVSSLTVDVGNQPLGTRRLPATRVPARMRFALPAGLLNRDLLGRPRRSVAVRLTFDLQVPQRRCVASDEDAAHATVVSTSKLTLPHAVNDDRDLARFPAPLAGAGRSVSVVLPRGQTSADLTAALQVAAAIGRWSEPQAPLPRLIGFEDLDLARERDSLALLGRAGAQLGARIEAPAGATALQPGEGLLAVQRSPWSPHLSVLSIIGSDDSGLTRSARVLAERAGVQQLAGSIMKVVPRAAPEATANVVPSGEPPYALAPVLVADSNAPERSSGWALSAALVLVAVLVCGGVLFVRRRRWAARRR
jgi:hypothetical protein